MLPLHFTPKILTIFKERYTFSLLKADIIAGLTVAIVALPLAMALGIASGASPDKGLITAVVAGFIISLLGGSRVQIGGPTGAFIVVVFNVISTHGYDGLLLATLLAGIILIIAGHAKMGQVIRYIPYPVITGFTAGIAVIIATSQIKDFFGLKMESVPAEFIPKWLSYFSHINTADLTTLAIGASSLFIIILLKRFLPKIPGYLVAVLVSALAAYFLHLSVDTIGSRFPDISSDFPKPSLPQWDFEKLTEVIPSAFTIAFLAGIEALLSATVADGMSGFKHRPNQELVAQGFANIASTLFGGLPATGAIARTATNIKSGGRTPFAGIFHALFVLVFFLFLMDYMAYIPLAALSAILFVVAWNMSEAKHFIHIFRLSKSDRMVMVLTFLLTILVDLTVAIGVGVTLASLLFVYKMSQSTTFHSQGRRIRDQSGDTKEDMHQRDDLPEGVEVFRFTGPIFFGVAETMLETLQSMGSMPRILIIRMKLSPYMDVAGLKAMKNLIAACHDQGSLVIFSGLQPQPMEMLQKDGIHDNQKDIFIVDSYEAAISLSLKLLENKA
ncbi:MAG TPA: sulfate permease [Alphaproteobacteria bacterium]|nr:sulfate permease [Alphaproteobacteria bacterium]